MKPSRSRWSQNRQMTKTKPTEHDDEIIERIARGDRDACALLLHRYRDRVMTLCLRMLGVHADAEEAAHDAFLRAFRALPQFEGRAKFSTWLYRITHNVCLTYLAKRKRMVTTITLDDDIVHEVETDYLETAIDEKDMNSRVMKAMEQLRAEYSTILTLFYLEDQGHDEISAITGLPLGTVKNRLHRARHELRALVLAAQAAPIHRNETVP